MLELQIPRFAIALDLFSRAEASAYWCKRCDETVEEKGVHYRYCLVLTVSDKSSVVSVTTFGNGWDKLFGITATNLHKYVTVFTWKDINYCSLITES